ncbi:LysR family transcriptional regulator [Sphingomonas sp. SUN019]|uniref:LysR family transcriptional regulator n=1 Tax=Sphingomonas sp. SUN019 TaxID=2937788 RepID=UPI0021644EA8|nr:LysR family transcriptional regulator [Sphingomonas sp. SUN019]UVO49904.1 LysR family transcriptional regulator [Sphingomonas sp. SUN019]
MLDRFEDLRTFVALAQTGGFASAADRLGIVKSAVSRRVREIEERLGVRLVQRTSRNVSLTEAGRGYAERARAILAELEEMDEAVRGANDSPEGTLRISAPVSFSIHCMAPAIVEFQRRHPGVAIELDVSDRFVDIVHDGHDLAVRIAALPDSDLVARRIVTIRHVVCASPAYLAAQGRPEQPEDLSRHHGIEYSLKVSDAYWTFKEGMVARPACILRANNGDTLREAAVAGAGLIYVPTFIVADAVARGALETVLDEHVREPIAMHAVFPAARHMPARLRFFIDFLVETFGDKPAWDRVFERGARP